MIRRIAHKTMPSRCRFIVYLCSELRFKSRTLPAATLLPELLTTGGALKHRAECAKIRLSHQKVRKRGLVGACRAPAECPKGCDSSSVSLMRRKKTPPYSRNTKRFSKNNSIAPQGKKPLCQTGIIRTRFSAADFRLNRVIRLANTGGY